MSEIHRSSSEHNKPEKPKLPLEVEPRATSEVTWQFSLPPGWTLLQPWGEGYACARRGLRVIVDCEEKGDGQQWIHVSVSRKSWAPSHEDMCEAKLAFIGDWRYAYAVWPPADKYVNIHKFCLHLWARLDGKPVLPEFSSILPEVGRSI